MLLYWPTAVPQRRRAEPLFAMEVADAELEEKKRVAKYLELYSLADYFQVDDLMKRCFDELKKCKAEQALQILCFSRRMTLSGTEQQPADNFAGGQMPFEAAHLLLKDPLYGMLLKVILGGFEELLQQRPMLNKLPKQVLLDLLSSEEIGVPEHQLYSVAYGWCKYQSRSLDSSSTAYRSYVEQLYVAGPATEHAPKTEKQRWISFFMKDLASEIRFPMFSKVSQVQFVLEQRVVPPHYLLKAYDYFCASLGRKQKLKEVDRRYCPRKGQKARQEASHRGTVTTIQGLLSPRSHGRYFNAIYPDSYHLEATDDTLYEASEISESATANFEEDEGEDEEGIDYGSFRDHLSFEEDRESDSSVEHLYYR